MTSTGFDPAGPAGRLGAAAAALALAACGSVPPEPSGSAAQPSSVPSTAPDGCRALVPTATPPAEPPGGLLAATDAVSGYTVSTSWLPSGDLTGWRLPAAEELPLIGADASAPLTLSSSHGLDLVEWRVVAVPVDLWPDPPADGWVALAGADEPTGDVIDRLCFASPDPGRWVVMARVDYGDGLGHGTFLWLLEVRGAP